MWERPLRRDPHVNCRDTKVPPTLSLADSSSCVRRFGGFLQLRRELVVDRDRHAVAQFEYAGSDDDLTRLQSGRDRNEIAARFADPHELLPDHLRFLPG